MEVTTSLSKVLKVHDGVPYEASLRKIPVDTTQPHDGASLDRAPVSRRSASELLEDTMRARREEAESILLEARAESEQILQDARAEADRIKGEAQEAGFQQGFHDGHQEGAAKAEDEYQQLLTRATTLIGQAQMHRAQLVESMREPLVQISMAAIRKILKRELATEPANLQGIVMDILSVASEATKVEVRVHPDDYATAIAAHPMWQSMKFGGWDVAVIPSDSITPGGCVVRFDSGRADATLEAKLDMLQEALSTYVERRVSEYADRSAE